MLAAHAGKMQNRRRYGEPGAEKEEQIDARMAHRSLARRTMIETYQKTTRLNQLYQVYDLEWAEMMLHFPHSCPLIHIEQSFGLMNLMHAVNSGHGNFDKAAALPTKEEYLAIGIHMLCAV